MGRRRWENENRDFEYSKRGGRHLRGCGFPFVGLVFGIVSFALTLSFKIIELIFQLLSQLISGGRTESVSHENKTGQSAAGEKQSSKHAVSYINEQAAAEIKKEKVKEFKRAEEQKSEHGSSEPRKNNLAEEDKGKDIYVIIFILTVIPGVLALAMGKPLYAGAVALAGFTLLIITGMIKGMAGNSKKKHAVEFEENVEESKDKDDMEKLIKEAFEKLFEIRKDISKIEDGEVKAKIEAICCTGEKIIGEVRTNPESLVHVRKFFYYYLDAFREIVKKYLRLSSFEQSSEEVGKLVSETERSFSDIDGIFKELCEKLLEKDMMHLKAELNVIKNSN